MSKWIIFDRLYASDFRPCTPPSQDQSRSLFLGPEIRVFVDDPGRRRDLVEHPCNSKGLHQGLRGQGPTSASAHQATHRGLIPISFSTFVTLSPFPSSFELALTSALSFHAPRIASRFTLFPASSKPRVGIITPHQSLYILFRTLISYIITRVCILAFRTSYRRNERRLCLTHPDSVPAENSYVARQSTPAVR